MQHRQKTTKAASCTKPIPAPEKIPFTDDWMFSMVMRDPEICRQLLERILPGEQFTQIQLSEPDGTFSNISAGEIRQRDRTAAPTPASDGQWSALTTQVQAALKFSCNTHGVRFDAYAKSENVWAEIEMQTYTGDHLGRRSRYYTANMDVDMLMEGADYKDLKRSYVIFICTHDYMKKGEPVYFFQHFDTENQLPLGDESYILILNTSCDAAKVPENLKALYAYINDPENTSEDTLMEKIDDQVARYNGSDWRWMQVTFEEHVKHMAYLAREEGKAEGLEEGTEHGRQQEKESIAAKLKASGMASSEIEEITGLSQDEIQKV